MIETAVARKRPKMRRTQISLLPEDYDKARRMADMRRISLSRVVRELVRSAPEGDSLAADPLRDLIGIVKDADPRGSEDHDEFIYGPDVH